jgi:hypothetical protein
MKWSMMLGSGFLALSLGSGALLAEEVATSEPTRTRTEAQQRLTLQDEGEQLREDEGEQLREQVRERKESGEGEQLREQNREQNQAQNKEQNKAQHRYQHQGSNAARTGSGAGRR